MKYFNFIKKDGTYYNKITTCKGVYNYFIKLKNVSELYIRNDSYNTICIVGYYNIYNYITKHYKHF